MVLRQHLRATGKVPVLAVRVNVLALENPSHEVQLPKFPLRLFIAIF